MEKKPITYKRPKRTSLPYAQCVISHAVLRLGSLQAIGDIFHIGRAAICQWKKLGIPTVHLKTLSSEIPDVFKEVEAKGVNKF